MVWLCFAECSRVTINTLLYKAETEPTWLLGFLYDAVNYNGHVRGGGDGVDKVTTLARNLFRAMPLVQV